MQNYFYRDKFGKEIGPLNLTTLAQLRFAGVLNDDTPVRVADSEKWIPCREVVAAAPSVPTQAKPVDVKTAKAPIPPFLVVLIIIGALIYAGSVLYKSIAAKTALTYGFLLDEKEMPAGQTPEVKVDGQLFENGDHLKPGSHKISVQLANVEPYEKHFWIFYGTKDFGKMPLETSKGSLSVTVSPSPANITLKRGLETVAQGSSPLIVDKLPVGEYSLSVSHGDCLETRTVEIQRQRKTETNVVLNLGSVNLSAAPVDAEYDLSGNGKHWQGQLPTNIADVPVGDYSLSVTRRGWELDSDIATTRGGITTNKTEFPYGSIDVTSKPSGLAVSTNGVEIGKTPLMLQELKPATYNLTVSDGENDLVAEVSVDAKENAKHDFVFRYGTIQLTSTPAGATVIRRGKEIGKTPLTLNHIPVGQSEVGLNLDGYVATNLTVSAIENLVTNFSVKLINQEYLKAMHQAQEAFDAGQFTNSQTASATALAIEPDDVAAIKLRDEAIQAVVDAKARALASLTWLDFQTVISNCTDTKQVQYPVTVDDEQYETYQDANGKWKQHLVKTGQHTEMQTRTESTFNPIEFSEKYSGKTFGFNCPGNWSVSKVEKDGSVTFKAGGFGADQIVATASVSNADVFANLQKGQKITIKAVVKNYNQGFLSRTLYLENAEILDK